MFESEIEAETSEDCLLVARWEVTGTGAWIQLWW